MNRSPREQTAAQRGIEEYSYRLLKVFLSMLEDLVFPLGSIPCLPPIRFVLFFIEHKEESSNVSILYQTSSKSL
jgi:hypothetical protein